MLHHWSLRTALWFTIWQKKTAYLFEKIGRNNESEYAASFAKELRSDIREHLIDKNTMTAAGESGLAYKIITNKGRTGYGYWIENGATTLWEDFKDKDDPCPDSKNHHFLGDISSWFIQELAGLKPNPNVDDIRYFEISPHFIDALDYAKASYESPFGRVKVMWQRNEHNIKLDISMPEGTYGKAALPDGYCFENIDTAVDLNGGRFDFTVKDDSTK